MIKRWGHRISPRKYIMLEKRNSTEIRVDFVHTIHLNKQDAYKNLNSTTCFIFDGVVIV